MENAAKIQQGFTIFAASPADDAHVAAAREYITNNNLTNEDVKFGRIGNSVVIVTKREILLRI